MASELDNRFVDNGSDTISAHLLDVCGTYQAGSSAPDTLRAWAQDAAVEIRRRKGLMVYASDEKDNLVKLLEEEGLRKWNVNTTPSLPVLKVPTLLKKGQSFSLLSNIGSGLGSFMSWDIIKEQSNGDHSKILENLRNIKHVGDIATEWEKEILPYLTEHLGADPDSHYSLYRELFYKCQSSPETWHMQTGLCQSVVDVINSSTNDHSQEQTKILVKLGHDMFQHWMHRDIFVRDQQVSAIGTMFWKWVQVEAGNRYTCGNQPQLTAVARSLMEIDPNASWLSSWTAHSSPQQCLKLAEEAITTISSTLLFCRKRLQDSSSSHRDIDFVCTFWLSSLHSILTTTRVHLFPWSKLDVQCNDDVKLLVWKLYIQLLMIKDDVSSVRICCDALDLLLSGCRKTEIDLYATMSQHVSSFREQNSTKQDLKAQLLAQLVAR